MKRELSLYLHIPFCIRKCKYCDFLSAPADAETKDRYVRRLIREIEDKAEIAGGYEVISVFFGGGTPTTLPAEDLAGLLDAIKRIFTPKGGSWEKAEITTECNPATYGKTEFEVLKKAGFNRLSIGLQSCDNEELKLLGRIHTYEDFLRCYEAARSAGFDNINIDLMGGLPCQSAEAWQRNLETVTALNPEHISAYSLIIEEGTPFYELYGEEDEYRAKTGESRGNLPDEETERLMYRRTKEILRSAGYERYEISNYAKPGRESRHNLVYWSGGAYLGLGLGAASYMDQVRFKNGDDLKEYLASEEIPVSEKMELSKQDRMEEFMFLGLRKMRGVSEKEFYDRFDLGMEEVYGNVLKEYEEEGLMERVGDHWRLTEKGIDVSNPVLAGFLLSS